MAKDAEFSTYGMFSSSLDSLPLDTLTTPYGTFRNVLAIADEHPAYADSTNSVKTLYWSKSEGYLRYDLYNGERWWLIDKY